MTSRTGAEGWRSALPGTCQQRVFKQRACEESPEAKEGQKVVEGGWLGEHDEGKDSFTWF